MREKVPGLIRILFIGDIVGKPGRFAVRTLLPKLVGSEAIDFVIANGENGAGVAGLTPKVADELLENGVDVLTSGNHIWRKKEIEPYLDQSSRVLRPANYPAGVVGKGHAVLQTAGGIAVGVINLQGRVFMSPLESPFRVGDELISQVSEEAKIIVVDFHAEATSEKQALGWYFDGRVSAVVGTHTHVQTSDEQIRASGTAYITDVGMTGATDSVIGIKKEEAIAQLMSQTPKRFTAAKGGLQLQGVLLDVSPETGRSEAIERICLSVDG
jgi:metallophosphoesterase (TIGR00282 family)